jgi:hypothetical protein
LRVLFILFLTNRGGSFKVTTKEAVEQLGRDLKFDPAYFATWQANIAMGFYDTCKNAGVAFPQLHELANKAAHDFLCRLMFDGEHE